MYLEESEIDRSTFFQGDIIFNFPFPHLTLRNGKYSLQQQKDVNVIILSQTCDLQIGRERKDRFIFCPLRSVAQFQQDYLEIGIPPENIPGRVSGLQGNKTVGIFYLPSVGVLPDSFANFSKMTSLEIDALNGIQPSIRLKDNTRHFFVDRLQTFLCRAYDPLRR